MLELTSAADELSAWARRCLSLFTGHCATCAAPFLAAQPAGPAASRRPPSAWPSPTPPHPLTRPQVSEVLSLSLSMQGVFRPPHLCKQRFRQIMVRPRCARCALTLPVLCMRLLGGGARRLAVGGGAMRERRPSPAAWHALPRPAPTCVPACCPHPRPRRRPCCSSRRRRRRSRAPRLLQSTILRSARSWRSTPP